MRGTALASFLALVPCDARPNVRTAWVYPDAPELIRNVKVVGFQTFDQCQAAAQATLQTFAPSGDYECGHKCGEPDANGMCTCAETRK